MMALNSGEPPLAAFQPRHLFAFAVQLLDFPALAARVLCRRRGELSTVVRHDPSRAVSRHLDPEQLHLVVFGKAFDLNAFAVSLFSPAP
ncbi:MAG: hypothetical protein PHG00_01560 [Methylococcales bacterium]|nr:hypothetical protein [Methylococcales bacterium]